MTSRGINKSGANTDPWKNYRKIGMLKNFKFKRVTLNRPPGDLDWWIYKSNLYQ